MYENLHSFYETINNKSVWVLIKPNFREAVTLKRENCDIVSDGTITFKDKGSYKYVYVSEDAQWVLETDKIGYSCLVTEHTKKINTPLGNNWNKEFNRILQKCKKEYAKKKKEEIRLYFYNSSRNQMEFCYSDTYYSFFNSRYKYPLSSYRSNYCNIDKKFAKPEKSCFILGNVQKTIGLNESKMMDFIKPIHIIPLDFERDKFDFGGYEYQKNDLKNVLLKLLGFCIEKEYYDLEKSRIRSYLSSSEEKDDTISKYINEIWEAFKKGDVKKLRNLHEVLVSPQNCTGVEFKLILEKEINLNADQEIIVYFENGETFYMSAQWIADNIDKCKDTKCLNLGYNRYNFF